MASNAVRWLLAPFHVISQRRLSSTAVGPTTIRHAPATSRSFSPRPISAKACWRARQLREQLVSHRITKYNLEEDPVSIAAPSGALRIVVPGQFEKDKSVTLGGAGIRTNLELLQRVRTARPSAFIVYKPHLDIAAGYRKGFVSRDVTPGLCDLVVDSASILSLIDWADEVHTLTSLAGFEALLRGRHVVVYGQPFSAGWGLTHDRAPLPRRQRRLSLDELVVGALILYPRYIDPLTRLPCGPEILIDRLSAPHLWRGTLLTPVRQLQGSLFSRAKALAALCALRRQS